MLTKIMELLTAEGYMVGNVDTTIVLEKPRLSPHYPGMRTRLAEVLRIDEDRIGLKAKTYEKMGDIGEGNAIAAHAVALIFK
jgi:2-C-methyl-D-erythritol 2,4-cyclodiphosphate synthase